MVAEITVVGSLNMDLVIRAARIPRPGETIIGGQFQTAPGGKGANQAVAAARLGAQVKMIGRVGSDAFGESLLENLIAAGVDYQYVLRDPDAATGVALIVVDKSGENTIVVASGANMHLAPQDIEANESVIAASQALLLQLESPPETVQRAVEIARANQVTIILNPAPARHLPPKLLQFIDILIPNEIETALLTGMPVSRPDELEAAAQALLASGVGIVILTLGDRGALLALRDGSTQWFPAYKVDPVDTTAAGDAFLGGFAVALVEGKSFPDAVRWGNAAGALATTRMGAQPSLPDRREVQAFLGSQPKDGVTP